MIAKKWVVGAAAVGILASVGAVSAYHNSTQSIHKISVYNTSDTQKTPGIVRVATPSPSPTPVGSKLKGDLVYIAKPNVNKLATPVATPQPSPVGLIASTMPAEAPPWAQDGGIWTPYNPHCFADCFPDLTDEKLQWAMLPYQGSFQAPAMTPGGEPVFKGLLNMPEQDHYNCEYFHVIGYMPAFHDCAAMEAGPDPTKP